MHGLVTEVFGKESWIWGNVLLLRIVALTGYVLICWARGFRTVHDIAPRVLILGIFLLTFYLTSFCCEQGIDRSYDSKYIFLDLIQIIVCVVISMFPPRKDERKKQGEARTLKVRNVTIFPRPSTTGLGN